MTQNITGDHIISTLKILGFTESAEKAEKPNYVSLKNGEHKISIAKGILEADETSRVRTELGPIFKALDTKISASTDATLLSVKEWLKAPAAA